jgi:hypothetical protein
MYYSNWGFLAPSNVLNHKVRREAKRLDSELTKRGEKWGDGETRRGGDDV